MVFGKLESQRIKVNSFSIPCTKNKLKMDKDLCLRPETTKFLEENRGSMLFDIDLTNIFLDLSP